MSTCSVSVIGAGGTGGSFLEKLGATPGIPQYLLDTSDSKFGIVSNAVEKLLIGTQNAEGAGKDRAKHAALVDAHLRQMFAESSGSVSGNGIPGIDTDVSIIMYSGSGGSGSVIGPLYAKFLREAGKRTIECVSLTSHAMVNSANSLGTLKTIANYSCSQSVPIILIPVKGVNFRDADAELIHQVRIIISQMTTDIVGLDTNDRLTCIGPKVPGIYLTSATEEAPPDANGVVSMKEHAHTEFRLGDGNGPVTAPIWSALTIGNKNGYMWTTKSAWVAIGENADTASVLLLQQGNARISELIEELSGSLAADKAALQTAQVQHTAWQTNAGGGMVVEDFF